MGEVVPHVRKTKRRRSVSKMALIVTAICAAVACAFIALGLASMQQERVAEAREASASFTPAPAVLPESPSINAALLDPGTRALIFGDSWTRGTGATTADVGYAYLLGRTLSWDYTVSGAGGTGYVASTAEGNYLSRVEALPVDPSMQLVVLQGSVNDMGQDVSALPAAAGAVMDAMQAKFPNAQIVVLGPVNYLPTATTSLVAINRVLAAAASENDIPYISPTAQRWITEQNQPNVIGTLVRNHPSDGGHVYLAERTAAALKELVASS